MVCKLPTKWMPESFDSKNPKNVFLEDSLDGCGMIPKSSCSYSATTVVTTPRTVQEFVWFPVIAGASSPSTLSSPARPASRRATGPAAREDILEVSRHSEEWWKPGDCDHHRGKIVRRQDVELCRNCLTLDIRKNRINGPTKSNAFLSNVKWFR